jgi:uncharacterized protein (DUF362 family)
MFKFTLPKGAIVEILHKRYVYLGDGEFSSYTCTDVPRVIEGVLNNREDKDSDTVLLTPYLHTHKFRVVWMAKTAYEILNGHDDPNIHMNEDGYCYYRDESIL